MFFLFKGNVNLQKLQALIDNVGSEHIASRIGQVMYLDEKLVDAGVPIVKPIESHGIFVNVALFLEHVPRSLLPT